MAERREAREAREAAGRRRPPGPVMPRGVHPLRGPVQLSLWCRRRSALPPTLPSRRAATAAAAYRSRH
eukprot:7385738-Prymnesium_polylepis.2